MYSSNVNNSENPSVIAALRSLIPNRRCTFLEALRLAELQANRLRDLLDVTDEAFPTQLIEDMARLRVIERDKLPVSGASYWAKGSWIIALNSSEPWQRRRLTLLHELKHILDHGKAGQLYSGTSRTCGEQQAEQAADYFAGCALVPKRLLKRAYGHGMQQPSVLAELFAVSTPAIAVRLAQTGLTGNENRCKPPQARTSRWTYFRLSQPAFQPEKGVAA